MDFKALLYCYLKNGKIFMTKGFIICFSSFTKYVKSCKFHFWQWCLKNNTLQLFSKEIRVCFKCDASPRKPYNVGETIFFFLVDLNSPDYMLQIDIQFANYLPSSPSKEIMESLKFSFPSVFLASWALHMISDFTRVTWWRTWTTNTCLPCNQYKILVRSVDRHL